MLQAGAYVDQIPAHASPPAAVSPAVRASPGGALASPRALPPGLYVHVASVATQEQAVETGLELAQRLGPKRPPVIRGEVVMQEGRRQLHLYAGPFVDEEAARRFCAVALPGQTCRPRVFASAERLAHPQPKPQDRPKAGAGNGGS